MRGLFTVGVIDVLMENGIEFDGMIGVSAGAAFGCNFKSRQIGRALRYNINYCKDKRYCSLYSLITTGNLYGAEFCYHELPDSLDLFDYETFNDNPMESYVVCTDVDTGKPVYKKCEKADYNYLEWLRASASMPIASKVVEVDGYRLLDGGLSDSVPIQYFESIGYDKNVVVLTQPEGYVKKKASLGFLMKLLLRKTPKVWEILKDRHTVYNETSDYIKQKEKAGEVIVIRPKAPLRAGKIEHNPDILREAYEEGREAALKKLDAIKAFIR